MSTSGAEPGSRRNGTSRFGRKGFWHRTGRILLLCVLLTSTSTAISWALPLPAVFTFKGMDSVGFPFVVYHYDKEPWAGQKPYWRNRVFALGLVCDLVFWLLIAALTDRVTRTRIVL